MYVTACNLGNNTATSLESLRFALFLCSLLSAFMTSCSSAVSAPVRHAASGVYVLLPAEVNGVPATFLLDTGSTNTVVAKKFADRIELRGDLLRRDFQIDARTPEKILEGQYAAVNSLTVGSVRLRRSSGHVLIVDLPNLSALAGEAIDGILGNSTLGSADYILNVSRPSLQVSRKLRLSDSRLARDLKVAGYKSYLPVEIDGRTYDFLLDTGSNATMATPDVLHALDGVRSDFVDLGIVTIDSAETKKLQRFRADLKLGDVTLRDFAFLVGDVNLIGLDLLMFGELSVSVRERKFVFRNNGGTQAKPK